MTNIKNHLISRGCPLDCPTLIISEEFGLAYFMLYNLSGQLIGYQKYNPDGTKSGNDILKNKYFTITKKCNNASKVHSAGEACIALLGNAASRDIKQWLSLLPVKKIAILDSDGKSLLRSSSSEFYYTPSPYKDLEKCLMKKLLILSNL